MSVRYEARGSVRGSCGHQHRTISRAQACADQDDHDCGRLSGGAYSDRVVRRLDGELLTVEECEALCAYRMAVKS